MKRIVNGMRYDTEKAVEIGTHHNGCYPASGDFSHWSATLYKTPRSGKFFLAGKGGAMTMFAQHCSGGSSCGGELLTPMTSQDAQDWAERYLDTDEVERHFDIEDA